MATVHSTSLDAAIRDGRAPWWLALPLAAGWLLYVVIAIPVALCCEMARRITYKPR